MSTHAKMTRDEARTASIDEIERRGRVDDAARVAMQLPAITRSAPTDDEIELVAFELAARRADDDGAARVILTLLDAWTRIRIDGLWGVFGGDGEDADTVLGALREIGEPERAAWLERAGRELRDAALGAERYEAIEAEHVAREERDPLASKVLAYARAHARELFADAA